MPRALRARTDTTHAPLNSTEADAAARVDKIKQRLKTLEARNAELVESQKRIEHEKSEVAAAIEEAEAELDAAVAAPVAGGEDPTLWLPDELWLLIFVKVVLVSRFLNCRAVCRRWQRLCQDRSVKEVMWEARWDLYAEGKLQPRELRCGDLTSLSTGNNGTMYCGTMNGSIEVRSDTDGSLLQTLTGHADGVWALAVGVDGTLYSGGHDTTIRVCSAETGAHIRTLNGHTEYVYALVVNEANLFSGSGDCTIRVWQCSTGDLVHTFTDLDSRVEALALGTHDQLYSNHSSAVIRVWSTADYTLLRTLKGHSREVVSLAVDKNGTLFSGSEDSTICVWSGTDGTLLRTLRGHTSSVWSVALAPNGTLFSSSDNDTRVWRHAGDEDTSITLPVMPGDLTYSVAFSRDGRLWASTSDSLYIY